MSDPSRFYPAPEPGAGRSCHQDELVNVEPGDFVCRSHEPHDGTNIEILRADPVIWVSVAFMAKALFDGMPNVELSHHEGTDLMTITARNRTVVYRIGRYDHDRRAYLCNWPD